MALNQYHLTPDHRYRAENDDYSIIMLKAVADRLAEVCIIRYFRMTHLVLQGFIIHYHQSACHFTCSL